MVDILLVEDEAELAELLRVYMEKAGYTVSGRPRERRHSTVCKKNR